MFVGTVETDRHAIQRNFVHLRQRREVLNEYLGPAHWNFCVEVDDRAVDCRDAGRPRGEEQQLFLFGPGMFVIAEFEIGINLAVRGGLIPGCTVRMSE